MPPTEEGRRQYLEAARERGLRMIADGAPLRSVLTHLAGTVEALAQGQVVASILLLDREGLLRNGASPNLPADYLDAIDRLKPDPQVGTCAAAAATGEIVLTPDFTADSRWSELRHLPMSLGFAGAWSQPIKAESGRVLGTFGTYFRVKREPTAQEREAVGLLAGVAARAIAESGAPVA
jgi:GAF domain-containing protein